MISLKTKNEIIRLRGLGHSFDSIAASLKVSKPTIMKTCKDYTAEIGTIQAEQISSTIQDATDSIEARSKLYRDLIKRLYSELASRDLTAVSTDRLMIMLERAERSLAAIELRNNAARVSDFSDLSDEDLMKIATANNNATLPKVA